MDEILQRKTPYQKLKWYHKPIKEKLSNEILGTSYLRGSYPAWKVFEYGVFFGPYFPAFGLITQRYFVSLRIQSECEEIRTRKNSVFWHFSRSARVMRYWVVAKNFSSRKWEKWSRGKIKFLLIKDFTKQR